MIIDGSLEGMIISDGPKRREKPLVFDDETKPPGSSILSKSIPVNSKVDDAPPNESKKPFKSFATIILEKRREAEKEINEADRLRSENREGADLWTANKYLYYAAAAFKEDKFEESIAWAKKAQEVAKKKVSDGTGLEVIGRIRNDAGKSAKELSGANISEIARLKQAVEAENAAKSRWNLLGKKTSFLKQCPNDRTVLVRRVDAEGDVFYYCPKCTQEFGVGKNILGNQVLVRYFRCPYDQSFLLRNKDERNNTFFLCSRCHREFSLRGGRPFEEKSKAKETLQKYGGAAKDVAEIYGKTTKDAGGFFKDAAGSAGGAVRRRLLGLNEKEKGELIKKSEDTLIKDESYRKTVRDICPKCGQPTFLARYKIGNNGDKPDWYECSNCGHHTGKPSLSGKIGGLFKGGMISLGSKFPQVSYETARPSIMNHVFGLIVIIGGMALFYVELTSFGAGENAGDYMWFMIGGIGIGVVSFILKIIEESDKAEKKKEKIEEKKQEAHEKGKAEKEGAQDAEKTGYDELKDAYAKDLGANTEGNE